MTVLTVQGEIPPSPNILRRRFRNPHAYRRLRTAWELLLVAAAPGPHHRTRLVKQAQDAKKMWCTITISHSKAYDTDNATGAVKVVVDALVNIGFLAGDSPDKLLLYPVIQKKVPRAECSTEIRIGVVESEHAD